MGCRLRIIPIRYHPSSITNAIRKTERRMDLQRYYRLFFQDSQRRRRCCILQGSRSKRFTNSRKCNGIGSLRPIPNFIGQIDLKQLLESKKKSRSQISEIGSYLKRFSFYDEFFFISSRDTYTGEPKE